jgi:hypothetical protein
MGQGMQPGAGFSQSAQDGMLAFDANQDGAVTENEFVAGTDRWFAMRDSNTDGTLSLEDFGPRR